MGLSSALQNSLAGLRTTQSQIEIISQNVANADSVGYTKRRPVIVQELTGDRTSGVRVTAIDRALDAVVQRQLRTENAGAAYTDLRADFYGRIDQIFGAPGSVGALDQTFNGFLQSLQALSNDPANYTVRAQALTTAQDIANRINGASADIQALRDGAESRIAASVDRLNTLLTSIDRVNRQITGSSLGTAGEGNAALQDERDRLIDEVSQLADIEVLDQANGGVIVLTKSGLQLVGTGVARFAFDRRYNLSANTTYDVDPTLRKVGTITLVSGGGLGSDMIAGNAFRSGEIAALIEMRDRTLVEAQNQLDDLAAGLAETTANRQVDGVAVGVIPATGFRVDTTGIQPGNAITMDFTTLPGTTRQRISVVRVDTPAAQAVAEATSNAAQQVFAIDFSGGVAAAAAALQTKINTAYGAGLFTVSAVGSDLQIVGSVTRRVDAMFGSISNTGLTGQGAALPLFSDASTLGNYTGSFETGLSQRIGFGERITVNPAVLGDPSSLVKYDPATPAGDATRPNFLIDRLTQTTRLFSPTTGIGTNGAPFSGTVAEFSRRIVEDQGANSAGAKSLDEGQRIVLNSIQKKFAEASGVNIDEELSELVQVQNAYAANARLISTVRELFDTLLRI
jgi:flagellar hook-associated protein 1